jgi:hypothetical protein
MVGGRVRAKHDVEGKRVGLRERGPFPIAIFFHESSKVQGVSVIGPSHDDHIRVPILQDFTEEGHLIPNGLGVGLRGAYAGVLTQGFLKVNAGLPIAEGDLDRHAAESLAFRGGGVSAPVRVGLRPSTNKFHVLNTGKRVFNKAKRFGCVLILLLTRSMVFFCYVNREILRENITIGEGGRS